MKVLVLNGSPKGEKVERKALNDNIGRINLFVDFLHIVLYNTFAGCSAPTRKATHTRLDCFLFNRDLFNFRIG